MEEVLGIVVCGSCHTIFNSGDMSQPCPKCQGAMVIGMAACNVLDAIDDQQVMQFINDTGSLDFEVGEILAGEGFEYNPEASYPNRLTKIVEEGQS